MTSNLFDVRDKSKNILKLYLKNEKNINIIEKRIYDYLIKNEYNDTDFDNIYLQILYQITHSIKNGYKITEVGNMLKEGKILFDHPEFDLYKKKEKEHDEYLANPFKVVDGLVKCTKCKSMNTICYSKQDRKADEALSVYAQCFNCHHKWRENN